MSTLHLIKCFNDYDHHTGQRNNKWGKNIYLTKKSKSNQVIEMQVIFNTSCCVNGILII